MATGWRYRIASVGGTVVFGALALWVSNLPLVQQTFSLVPYFGRPAPAVLSNGDLVLAASTMLAVTLAAMWPVFKPRPRRILDTILLTQKRVLLAMIALAALGYFNYDYRLPRSTLMLATGLLLLTLPVWTAAIRRRPSTRSRAVIVGDDPVAMEALIESTDIPIVGYVSPPSSEVISGTVTEPPLGISDGGTVQAGIGELPCLGGLSRLDAVIVTHDIDTALLAFRETDRREFFGALDTCYEHGVTALAHRAHADSVLTAGVAGGDLVEIDIEPWDWQDYAAKRAFDLVFASMGLLVLAPVCLTIALAIKLDSRGPVLYSQERTAEFGQTFTVYKFRTMTVGDETTTPTDDDENPRITRVGGVLRRTHLDEIPQLLSILLGRMSVVGPRAAWTDEEDHLEQVAESWRKRWFVKPGLTGLAQINDVTSKEPDKKLRYDIEYIRRQSFWFDLRIVVRQIWQVLLDIGTLVTSDDEADRT